MLSPHPRPKETLFMTAWSHYSPTDTVSPKTGTGPELSIHLEPKLHLGHKKLSVAPIFFFFNPFLVFSPSSPFLHTQ